MNQTQIEKTREEIKNAIKDQTKIFLHFYGTKKENYTTRSQHIMGMIEMLTHITGHTELITWLRSHHHWLKLKADYLSYGLDVDVDMNE